MPEWRKAPGIMGKLTRRTIGASIAGILAIIPLFVLGGALFLFGVKPTKPAGGPP